MCRDPAIMKRRDGRLEELEVDRVALDGLGPHERERLAERLRQVLAQLGDPRPARLH